MDEVVFKLSGSARRDLWMLILVISGVMLALVLSEVQPRGPIMTVSVSAACCAMIFVGWAYNEGRTAVGPNGIRRSWGFLPMPRVAWNDVKSIEVDSTTGFFGTRRTLLVTIGSGRRFRLAQIEDSLRKQDSHFDEKCKVIMDAWGRYK